MCCYTEAHYDYFLLILWFVKGSSYFAAGVQMKLLALMHSFLTTVKGLRSLARGKPGREEPMEESSFHHLPTTLSNMLLRVKPRKFL